MITTQANRQRAYEARMTLSHTAMVVNGMDVAIIDQLTNLMHLCAQCDLDFATLADVADGHFKTETKQ